MYLAGPDPLDVAIHFALDLGGEQVQPQDIGYGDQEHHGIGEIQHEDQTTLGLRIGSDSSILVAADTAIGGAASGQYTQSLPIFGGTVTLGANANVALNPSKRAWGNWSPTNIALITR